MFTFTEFVYIFCLLFSGEAAIQEKELAEKQKEANDALIMIKETMQNASQQKTQMQDLRGNNNFLFVYTFFQLFVYFYQFLLSLFTFGTIIYLFDSRSQSRKELLY